MVVGAGPFRVSPLSSALCQWGWSPTRLREVSARRASECPCTLVLKSCARETCRHNLTWSYSGTLLNTYDNRGLSCKKSGGSCVPGVASSYLQRILAASGPGLKAHAGRVTATLHTYTTLIVARSNASCAAEVFIGCKSGNQKSATHTMVPQGVTSMSFRLCLESRTVFVTCVPNLRLQTCAWRCNAQV